VLYIRVYWVDKMSEQKVKYIVRIHNTDLDGEKPIKHALTKIKGLGKMFANAVCFLSKVDSTKKAGLLTDDEINKLNGILKDPLKSGVPKWLFNRRNDPVDGKDVHLFTSDLDFTKANDIKLMQKMKCYKGVRHSSKLPARGQRTKSNFRRNKGKAASVFKSKQKK